MGLILMPLFLLLPLMAVASGKQNFEYIKGRGSKKILLYGLALSFFEILAFLLAWVVQGDILAYSPVMLFLTPASVFILALSFSNKNSPKMITVAQVLHANTWILFLILLVYTFGISHLINVFELLNISTHY